MLPVERRLRDSAAFRRTVKSGRRSGSAALVVHVREAPAVRDVPGDAPDSSLDSAHGPATVGFVVSKAVGGSVVRNRVRRRLRHLAAAHLRTDLADLAPGSEVVVRALPASAHLSSPELDAELTRCLQRARRTSASGPRTASRQATPGLEPA